MYKCSLIFCLSINYYDMGNNFGFKYQVLKVKIKLI